MTYLDTDPGAGQADEMILARAGAAPLFGL